jgi:hypothetical protein
VNPSVNEGEKGLNRLIEHQRATGSTLRYDLMGNATAMAAVCALTGSTLRYDLMGNRTEQLSMKQGNQGRYQRQRYSYD